MTSRLLLAWLLAAVVLTVTPTTGAAQLLGERGNPGRPLALSLDGTEMFQWMLHARDIKPLSMSELRRRLSSRDFGDVIVIVLDDPNRGAVEGWVPIDLASVAVESGGAVLLASDSELSLQNHFRRGQNVIVTGEEVYWPGFPDEAVCYQGQTMCPYVVPAPPPDKPGPEWGLFAGLDHLATNQPSALRLLWRDDFAVPLAGFPGGCMSRPRRRALDPAVSPFAAGSSGTHPDTGHPYRFLLLADPSVFINQMMVSLLPGEAADNAAFSNRVVQFLQEEDGQRRRRYCLFIQNGRLIDRFDALDAIMRPPPPPIPMPNLDKMQDKIVDAANQIVDKLQENDVPNTAARRVLRDVGLGALLVIGFWLLWYVMRVVWRFRQPTNTPPAPPEGRSKSRPGNTAPPAGIFDRRQRELLRRNNLFEPVRAAVREMFTVAGAPADAGPKLPRIVMADTLRRTDSLRKALADLWKIGYGAPIVVTVHQWTGLEPLFERVRQAHADGKWRFVAAEGGEA
ncbi:MAG: hypothetical protein JWO38_6465 [Gemmataceae bacterium]|nr:hypothetical protein [Gemmataceae bacterium]